MTNTTDPLQEHIAHIESASSEHYEQLSIAIAGIAANTSPLIHNMFESVGATDAEAAPLFEVQNLIRSVFQSTDAALEAQGVKVNPHKVGAMVVAAFASYVRNTYEPCQCGQADCDAVPDIEALIMTMAHGRAKRTTH